ncbi:MAG: hypothetical protein DWQ07_11140 [Chloroflexi bacterium]|nr:MAG: hypothetical protein DWQ07_11140 [Chloroflexota bacterium]MBL1192730.1 hypothetical protein [Chloroflexota bacterium]NOH10022.1 hypothetical protein [Chloroflexota bacterium]
MNTPIFRVHTNECGQIIIEVEPTAKEIEHAAFLGKRLRSDTPAKGKHLWSARGDKIQLNHERQAELEQCK